MIKENFIRGMLVIIALLLALNLFHGKLPSFFATEAVAKAPQKFSFRGNGIGIACSRDGKIVFAASNGGVYRSGDFGKVGSWEAVLH